jgi:hypothetical protein
VAGRGEVPSTHFETLGHEQEPGEGIMSRYEPSNPSLRGPPIGKPVAIGKVVFSVQHNKMDKCDRSSSSCSLSNDNSALKNFSHISWKGLARALQSSLLARLS